MRAPLTLDQCGDTLSLREFAAVRGVSLRTVQRWRDRGEMPVAELEPRGYHPRYSKVDVARYLANPHKGTAWQRRLQVAS